MQAGDEQNNKHMQSFCYCVTLATYQNGGKWVVTRHHLHCISLINITTGEVVGIECTSNDQLGEEHRLQCQTATIPRLSFLASTSKLQGIFR